MKSSLPKLLTAAINSPYGFGAEAVVVVAAAVVVVGATEVVVWSVVAGPAQATRREISNSVSIIVKTSLFILAINLKPPP